MKSSEGNQTVDSSCRILCVMLQSLDFFGMENEIDFKQGK